MRQLTTGLNPEQRKAVKTIKGPLLVLAGAGTGKTSVITHRIAYMLSQGVKPGSILAMTFTNKAAGEMKERIGKLLRNGSAKALTVGTFHSFCARALRQHGSRVGLKKNFAICDAADQLVAMKQALRDLQIPESFIQPRVCLSQVSLLKNKLVGPEKLLKSDDAWESTIGQAYQRYDQGLRASGLLDFDDLLIYMVRLLEDEKTGAAYRRKYRYLLVDEYQDTNGPQYEIVRLIGEKHRNVCVVGDDDQSIYGWRGADVSKILNFENDFPEAVVVRLETNYRSTSEILEGANAVIRNNTSRHEKALHSHAGSGEGIRVLAVDDEEIEAQFVVEDMLRRSEQLKLKLGEFAILFRTAVQPRLFEQQLRQREVPYTLVGGLSFFDRKEVRDILAYLKVMANPDDELSLLRVINVPSRGIGLTTIEKAMAAAAQQRCSLAKVFEKGDGSLSPAAVDSARTFLSTLEGIAKKHAGPDLVGLVRETVSAMQYDREIRRCYPDEKTRTTRWDAINEIQNMAEIHVHHKGKKASLAAFLEELTLSAVEDNEDKEEMRDDRVTLMTLHSAKGLEFGEVYLVGAEEGLLPHAKSIESGDVDEERRLAYVGITRAKRRLTMTFTRSRARYGQRQTTVPSRFLYEMRGQKPPEAPSSPKATPGRQESGDEGKKGRGGAKTKGRKGEGEKGRKAKKKATKKRAAKPKSG